MLLAISIAMAIVAMNRAISFRSNFILLIPPQISQNAGGASIAQYARLKPLCAAPAHGIHRAHGEKHEKHDEAQVVDHRGCIEYAARKIVVPVNDGQVLTNGAE